MSAAPRIVLASASRQRRAILELLGIDFEVDVAGVEELEQGAPEEVAVQNARAKAEVVAARHRAATVLGADTVVSLDGRLYGKPTDADQARATLAALSGRRHDVVGGICLVTGGRARTAVASTAVYFRRLAPGHLDWYVASGEWRDRAGAYAVQGLGAALVTRIEGDYLNVVGLPVATLLELEPGLLWG